jgi:hypothetical protein
MADPNNSTPKNPKEIWVEIPEFEGIYSVSNLGRIRRDIPGGRFSAGRILKPLPIKGNNYQQVCLYKNRAGTYWKIHRLVMLAFVGPRPEGMEIDHINCCQSDNRLINLEYVTAKTNRERAKQNGRYPIGSNNPNSKLTEMEVRHIRNQLNACKKGRKALSQSLAAYYGVSYQLIQAIVSRRIWRHID